MTFPTPASTGTENSRKLDQYASLQLSFSYNAIVQYGQEKIEEFGKLAASPKRQATLPDGRISAALFFVNALTTTRLSSLEMSTLKELAKFTNVILVIAKSDCLLPAELARIKFNVSLEFFKAF